MDEQLNKFNNSAERFNQAMAKLSDAFKELNETIVELELPDYTIQENLAAEYILNSTGN